MDAEQMCKEATGNAGAQISRVCLLHWHWWYNTTALIIRTRAGALRTQQKGKNAQQAGNTATNRQPLAPVIDLTDDNQPDNKRLCV